MILSDRDIRAWRETRGLTIEPWSEANLQPASYEVTLGYEFLSFEPHILAPIDVTDRRWIEAQMNRKVSTMPLILAPGGFALATTIERVEIPNNMVCWVNGKSSLGRLGLDIHATAGWLDPGFKGQITLELFNKNHRPLVLRPGMAIGQLVFAELSSPAERPYGSAGLGSHYQNQTGCTPAKAGGAG